MKGAHRKSGIGEVRSSRQQELRNPEPRYRAEDSHSQVLKVVKGLERTCGSGCCSSDSRGNPRSRFGSEEGI
jgi:hypothetical protein